MAEPHLPTTYHAHHGIPTPMSYKATVSDPDTLSYDEAVADHDHIDEWRKSAEAEIRALESKGTWVETTQNKAKTKVIPGTWVFRRKRTPDGTIRKYKGRYCVRGDLEEGEHETYAPVVSWSTVRIFLVLALTFKWKTCSIDFSNAFVQATLDEPVWIHVPRGFRSDLGPNACLELKKSLYGLTRAPRLWSELILGALTDKLGFTRSRHDSCLLYKKDIMIVLYVDDAGIAAAKESLITDLIKNLRDLGFELTQEGSFAEFLGIKFEHDEKENTMTLTQKGLIKKIIGATGMESCNPRWTPANQVALGSDPDEPMMSESWSYSSIVGMLLYLSTNTRPDIAFAVSQVARFSHSPRQTHATAVKSIVRYLHRTADKGTIVTPTGDLSVDCYVDADFAGLYGREPATNPSSVKSRTGFIIFLGGFPLLWQSKLQTEISLSTLEAEYSALSQAMRNVLPIRALLIEPVNGIGMNQAIASSIRCSVFEDNNGALLLATNQRITSRTKYFQVKWHFFWFHVVNGEVSVHKIETSEQRADYLTKGLSRDVFEYLRRLVQGW